MNKTSIRLRQAILVCVIWTSLDSTSAAQDAEREPDQAVIVVVGAEGTEEYGKQFREWAKRWKESANHTRITVIGLDEDRSKSKMQLKKTIEDRSQDESIKELWLVMIGHGTFDGKRSKFNLCGPDVDDTELKQWLVPVSQRTIVFDCTSSSSPFINALSSKNRIVVTATRNGFEYNFARFGKFISRSIDDPSVDLDKDGQTSVLEAFCAASRDVEDFYLQENRIATEHSLIDDNGDKKGTPAEWFEGVRTTRKPKEGIADGLMANQVFLRRRGVEGSLTEELRTRRNQLEARLESLRMQKTKMDETAYLAAIEPLLIDLAELYATTEKLPTIETESK